MTERGGPRFSGQNGGWAKVALIAIGGEPESDDTVACHSACNCGSDAILMTLTVL